MNFISFVGNADPAIPTNPVLLPRALAAIGHRVMLVEVRDRQNARTLQPWQWGRTDSRSPRENLTVITYVPSLPARVALTASMERKIMRRAVLDSAKRLWGEEPAYLLIFSPNEARFREIFPELPFAYRVIDDYPTMPFYAADPEGCRREDERLCREAVAVFASNPKLLEQRKHLNPRHLLVPNGVDYDHFARTDLPVPNELAELPRPIVGFSGAVDAYKVDFSLLADLARLRPTWSFVLVGKVGVCDDTAETALPSAPNLHYLGFRPYDVLPAYVAAMDVGIIPYGINPYTEGVSPLKLYEYLAAGKGVVTTPLPFAEAAGSTVRVAADAQGFVEAIEDELAHPERAEARRAAAAANSWSERAKAIAGYLLDL